MSMQYKQYFSELCKHMEYSTVIYFRSTGEIIGYKNIIANDNLIPKRCSINFSLDLLPKERSKVFYGLNLSLDKQIVLCNGSINLIDIEGDEIVIVFFDSGISSFRDNQVPRILWKSKELKYLGHSEYVPYENNIDFSMVGKTDEELFSPEFIEDYSHSDTSIIEKQVCFWNLMGKIKVNVFSTWVKMEKFPYYSTDNRFIGIILIYYPINQVVDTFLTSSQDAKEFNQQLMLKSLANANIYLIIMNVDSNTIEYYTENFSTLTYDFSHFLDGTAQFKDIVSPKYINHFIDQYNEYIFIKKESFSLITELYDKDADCVSSKLTFTPMLDHSNRVIKIAVVIEFIEDDMIHSIDYLKLKNIVDKGYMVFTVRDIFNPTEFDLLTDNISQYGYSVNDFLNQGLSWSSIIQSDYLEKYLILLDNLKRKVINQAVIEYPILTKKHQINWIKESLFAVTIDDKTYIESTIENINSSHQALETLKQISSMKLSLPDDGIIAENIYSTVVKYADIPSIISPLVDERVDVAVYDNNDSLMVPFSGHPDALPFVMNSLKNYQSLAIESELSSHYANLFFLTKSIELNSSKTGTLFCFAVIDDYIAKDNDRIYEDSEGVFKHINYNQIDSITKHATLTARSIALSLNSAAMILLQMQSVKSFQGAAFQQKLNHEILLELLNIANTSTDVIDCFQRILPKIGKSLQLSRASMFKKEEDESFSLIAEWYSEIDVSRKEVYTNIKKQDTFFCDWDWRKNTTYVINTQDIVKDPDDYRKYSKAVVGVRITIDNMLFGSVNFADNHSTREWTEDEVILMEDIGYILSSVIEKSSNRREIEDNKRNFFSTLEAIPNPVALVSHKNHRLLFANSTFKSVFLKNIDIDKLMTESLKKYHSFDAMLSSNKLQKNPEIYINELDKWYLINRTAVSLNWAEQSELYILSDVTQNKKIQETVTSLAFTDVLTGLPNRLKFERDLEVSFNKTKKQSLNTFIGILNIDNFKMINNTFGYSFGDSLLKTISDQIGKITEISDKLYRFGGDEFSFYVDHLYSDQVYEVANKIMKLFETPFVINEYEMTCTVSLGIAFWNDTSNDVASLIKKASLSLADAKASGKNKFVVYNIGLQKFEEDTFLIENELRRAIKADCEEFKLHFQPIVEAKTGKIISVEALARWYSSKFGLVSPVKFIPIAETTGLIIPLGRHILDLACKEAKRWIDNGFDIHVSVNFSVIQMLQSDLISMIIRTLQKHRLPPKNLMVEVTESLAINDINKVIDILTQIKQIGVKIAMDDFGTGYSSLNHLRRLPLNYVKFDRSFIFNIEFDPYTVSFVDAISKFCHMKDMQVCCEGVETSTQRILLQSVGVNYLQGYLFGKPVPADEFMRILKPEL